MFVQRSKRVSQFFSVAKLRQITKSTQNCRVVSSESAEREIDACVERLDLSFKNTKEAYKSKSTWELLRGLFVLKLCSFPWLVQRNPQITQLLRKLTGKRLFEVLMRATIYGHFVAGSDEESIKPVVSRMRQCGVKSIMDYSVESDMDSETAVETEMESCGTDEKSEQQLKNFPDQSDSAPLRRYQAHERFSDRREGVVSARTYFYRGEPECDRNMETFLKCIDSVAHTTEGTGFVAIKLTALGRPSLLLQLSQVIAQTQQFYRMLTGCSWENLVQSRLSVDGFLDRLREFGVKTDSQAVQDWFARTDFDADGFVDIYEWGRLIDNEIRLGELFTILNLKTGAMEPLLKTLTEDEEMQMHNMMARLNRLAEHALQKGVRLMIDAEQTYFQPAISRLTLELMRKYNGNVALIFNTYQTYLKNALNSVRIDMHLARRENFHFGAKLVRGAYMVQERQRAKEIGYEDPINPTFEDTTRMYERVLEEIMSEWLCRAPDKVSVMCATHNEDSVRFGVQLMKRLGINPSQRVLCFGQLYGMCDQVSFSLGQAGFSVYKYVPYGPVEEVLPYLSRRAQENSGLMAKVQKERRLMRQEVWRRARTGGLWRKGFEPPKEPVAGPNQVSYPH